MADVEALKRQHQADIEAVKQKARDAIKVLQGNIQAAKDEAQNAKNEAEQAKHALEEARMTSQKYEQRIAELNEAVRSQQEAKVSDERDERIAALNSELAHAQDEIARLSSIPAASSGSADVSQLEEKLRATEAKLGQLKDAAKNHVTKLQAELAAREKERNDALTLAERLKSELEAARSSSDTSNTSISPQQQAGDTSYAQELASRFEKAEANLQQATILLEESERAKKQAQDQAAKLESDMAQIKDAAKRHVEKLNRELEKKKEVEEQIRKQFEEENRKVSDTYEAQIKALKEASASASAAATSAGRTPPPSDALVRMNKENKDLQSKLEAATKALSTEREDFKAQSRQSRETIERLTSERTQLKRDLDSAKEEARLTLKDLEKVKADLKKLQEQRVSADPAEMQKRKEAEVQVYIDRNLKLEAEVRKEQTKCEELHKQVQRLETEVARITGQSLEKSTRLERELVEKREAVSILEEQTGEYKRTAALNEQQLNDFKRKSREQFQALLDQLEQARKQLEQAKQQEESFRAEIGTLRRQSDKAAAAVAAAAGGSMATPSPSPPPTPTGGSSATTSVKMLEEEKARAESRRKEAMDDLSKAKRDYNSAKREAIQLAEAVDRLRSGLNKAALQAGGNLALAADRCDDALRQCVLQIEAAAAAIQARELTKQSAPSQSAGLAGAGEEDSSVMRHRQSSIDSSAMGESSSLGGGRKEVEPEERLVNALSEAERRLDEMTSTLRTLLPKVKHVVTVAVQDKKAPSLLATICNLTAVLNKLFPARGGARDARGGEDEHHGASYQGLQMGGQQRSGLAGLRNATRRGRVLPDTPGNEPHFDLEEE